MCKFSYFPDDVYVNEYLWYAYTIPLTTIPMCFFLAALYVEPVRDKKLIVMTERLPLGLRMYLREALRSNL